MSVGQTGITVFRTGGGGNRLLETGQTTCYAIGDDGDVEAGADQQYTVTATAGTTNIQVAHYAGNQISFTAPNTVADGNNGFGTIAVNDTIVVKGSGSNDGTYTVAGVAPPNTFTTNEAVVNEAAGTMISLYKQDAHSNNVVTDNKTRLMWSRYSSDTEKVGEFSNGRLDWYDAAGSRFTLYAGANTVSCIAASNVFRIVGGAGATQFHEGDCIECAGFANGVNNTPFMYVVSAADNGADHDITVDPGEQTLIAEGAVGDTIYLNCRSCFNYAAGARLGSLGGYTDWRIPNWIELNSLVNAEAPNGAPDAAAFPSWNTSVFYWASTSVPNAPNSAKCSRFADAYSGGQAKTAATVEVALVRLGV